MTCQDSNILLNNVLIDMARSFLQYVADCWPWVAHGTESLEEQVRVLAARQRQDVMDIVALLQEREHAIDFGSFPTEYTDLHFISLESLLELLQTSQKHICQRLAAGVTSLRTAGDVEAADLLTVTNVRQTDLSKALLEIHNDLDAARVI